MYRSFQCGSAEKNLTSIHEDAGLIPGLTHLVKDLLLLWLWCRPAATALIRPLAWELPYAAGATLKRKRKKKEYGPDFIYKEAKTQSYMTYTRSHS